MWGGGDRTLTCPHSLATQVGSFWSQDRIPIGCIFYQNSDLGSTTNRIRNIVLPQVPLGTFLFPFLFLTLLNLFCTSASHRAAERGKGSNVCRPLCGQHHSGPTILLFRVILTVTHQVSTIICFTNEETTLQRNEVTSSDSHIMFKCPWFQLQISH